MEKRVIVWHDSINAPAENDRIRNIFAVTRIIPVMVLVLLLSSLGVIAQEQQGGTIRGKLVTADGKPVEFATVALLRNADSAVVKGTISNPDGSFVLQEVAHGTYYINASFMGYQPLRTAVFILSAKNNEVQLDTLRLLSNEKILGAVTVTARKPLLEQRADRTILNIENSILSEGNTALELLQKAPGVTVAENGSISLKGKPGVNVMLNGKLTYLSQQELTHLLRGTTSNSVSKIEIIPNPPAKYDAAGTAGIINIVLKKSEKSGLNGNVYTNYARSRANRYGAGMSLNYGGEKANVYGSYNHAFRGEVEYLDYIRRFRNEGHTGAPDRTSYSKTATDEPLYTNNFKAGADYHVNAKNTIGVLLNGNVGKYNNNSVTNNRLVNTAEKLIYDAASNSNSEQRWTNLSYNLNYLHKFDKPGQEISFDLDHTYNDFKGKQYLATRYKDEEGQEPLPFSSRKGDIPSLTKVYVAKVDYTQPFWGDGKFETGWKSSYVTVNNDLKYDTLRNEQWVPDANTSNHFKYKESIHAGYLNFSKEVDGWSLQAGVRGEYTRTTGHQVTTDSLVKRDYLQIFPSLAVSKTLRGDQKLQFSYSRRVERPDYDELNPFRVFRDPYLYYEGNPFLQPQLTDAVELSHVLHDKLTSSIYYSNTSKVVNWVMGQDNTTNTSYEQPQNLKSMVNYGVSLTASMPFTKWWSANYFFNLFHTVYKGNEQNEHLFNEITGYSFNLQNAFQFGKGFSGELSGYYESKGIYGMFVTEPIYVVSLGAQKQLFNNKYTAKIMVNDLFQTDQWKQRMLYDNIDMNGHVRFDSRKITVSLSYRFGSNKTTVRERKSGSEDINSRVKSGG